MSIMTDARLRLLEARVAELERRLGERVAAAVAVLPEAPTPPRAPARAAKKTASKPRKRGRKTP